MYTNQKGFTLIEILIAMAIVAILSAGVLVGLNPVRAKARDARRISDLRQVQTGLELYFSKSGQYPPAVGTGASNWEQLKSDLTGAGIGVSTIPQDPNPGASYEYGVDFGQSNYVLKAVLETPDQVLNDDIDGQSANGTNLNCEDPAYCIGL